MSSPITVNDPVTLNCTVKLVPAVTNSDLSALVVDVQLSRPNGSPLSLSGPIISDTTFTYTTQVNSFGRNDSGVYTCGASVRPKPSLSEFLTESSQQFGSARVTTGINCIQAHSQLSMLCAEQHGNIGEPGDEGSYSLKCESSL